MPDSPKCVNCLKKGTLGQTYRIAGTQKFKCASCHQMSVGPFEPIEFLWKEQPASWKTWADGKKFNITTIPVKDGLSVA